MIETIMPYSALAVANSFIGFAQENSDLTVTPMKLQKLLYFAHGWNLALSNAPLISEHVEAWKFGPVFPTVYHKFKDYGNEPITEKAVSFNDSLEGIAPQVDPLADVSPLIKRIWEIYGRYSGIQLSNATHQAGTPWQITWDERGGKDRQGTDISDDLIRDYFKGLVTA
jgi:uncharacterized phage-associated protein